MLLDSTAVELLWQIGYFSEYYHCHFKDSHKHMLYFLKYLCKYNIETSGLSLENKHFPTGQEQTEGLGWTHLHITPVNVPISRERAQGSTQNMISGKQRFLIGKKQQKEKEKLFHMKIFWILIFQKLLLKFYKWSTKYQIHILEGKNTSNIVHTFFRVATKPLGNPKRELRFLQCCRSKKFSRGTKQGRCLVLNLILC